MNQIDLRECHGLVKGCLEKTKKNRWKYGDILLQARGICGSWTQSKFVVFFAMVLSSKIFTSVLGGKKKKNQSPVSSDTAELKNPQMMDHLSLLQTYPQWFHVVPLWERMDDKQ